MSNVKLRIGIVEKAIRKAIEAEISDMVALDPHAGENDIILEILEHVSAIKNYKEQLSIIESLPVAGSVSFEPF
jgi:uncharacterized radical SAM superfamily protein